MCLGWPKFEVRLWLGPVLGETMSFLCPKASGGVCTLVQGGLTREGAGPELKRGQVEVIAPPLLSNEAWSHFHISC